MLIKFRIVFIKLNPTLKSNKSFMLGTELQSLKTSLY